LFNFYRIWGIKTTATSAYSKAPSYSLKFRIQTAGYAILNKPPISVWVLFFYRLCGGSYLTCEWAKSLYATLVLLSAIFSNRFEAPLK
jgi:hypothetical protein